MVNKPIKEIIKALKIYLVTNLVAIGFLGGLSAYAHYHKPKSEPVIATQTISPLERAIKSETFNEFLSEKEYQTPDLRQNNIWLLLPQREGTSFCSGGIITREGHTLTANHCIKDLEDKAEGLGRDKDGKLYPFKAEILYKNKEADIALLQINDFKDEGFKPLKIRWTPAEDNENIKIISHRKDENGDYVSRIDVAKIVCDSSYPYRKLGFYQTDYPAIQGQSGALALDNDNKVVGILVAGRNKDKEEKMKVNPFCEETKSFIVPVRDIIDLLGDYEISKLQ